MNRKIITLLMMISTGMASAEYTVVIPLPKEGFSGIIETPSEVVRDLKVSRNVIDRGDSTNLTWNYNDLEEISIQGNASYLSTNKKGTFLLSPNITTTYTVVIKHGGETTTQQITITVNQPAPTAEFTASSLIIGKGDTVNLIWNTENVEFIEIVGLISKTEFTNTSYSVAPTATTTYTLIAYGYQGQGNITKTVTIDVQNTAVINSFTVDKTKFSVGDTANFNWNVFDSISVKLNGTTESAVGTRAVPLATVGNFNYKLEVTSFNGLVISQDKVVDVYAIPSLDSLTVNDTCCGLTVPPDTQLNLKWTDDGVSTYVLNGSTQTGGAMTIMSKSTSSTTNYIMVATNPAGRSVTRGVVVSVMLPAPILSPISAPNTVFRNAAFTLSFTATGATNYTIKSSGGSGSGISGTIDMGTTTNRNITPTSTGNYTYTVTATNAAGTSVTQKVDVAVVADPTISSFTTSATSVGPNDTFTLSWSVSNAEIVSVDRGVGVVSGSSKSITAPATNGSYVYTLTNSKTLNGVTRSATPRTVTITVAAPPVITSFTGPTTGKQYMPFSVYWSGTNTVDYKLTGSVTGSGVSTAVTTGGEGVITPQVQGVIVYTLTATSASGIKATQTLTVNIGPPPI
jgi:hypothetical protein